MKNLNLIRLLFLSCILFSCQPKKEIQEKPMIKNTVQNYRYDDDDIRNKSYHDTIKTKNTGKKKKVEN
jgi:hypothetical protein